MYGWKAMQALPSYVTTEQGATQRRYPYPSKLYGWSWTPPAGAYLASARQRLPNAKSRHVARHYLFLKAKKIVRGRRAGGPWDRSVAADLAWYQAGFSLGDLAAAASTNAKLSPSDLETDRGPTFIRSERQRHNRLRTNLAHYRTKPPSAKTQRTDANMRQD